MLMRSLVEIFGTKAKTNCDACAKSAAVIQMHGYAEDHARNRLCADCALQLTRKITEGRHG